jgi:hypothetical protein
MKLEVLRCRHGQQYTFTSECKSYTIQTVIAAGKPGQISLQQLPEKVKSVKKRIDTKKHHKTVGFYSKLVRTAVDCMLQGEQEDCNERIAWEGDVGGYRDVGLHTGVVPLSTCWPLVEQVFRYLATQVCCYLCVLPGPFWVWRGPRFAFVCFSAVL